jgi:hypothetical protein
VVLAHDRLKGKCAFRIPLILASRSPLVYNSFILIVLLRAFAISLLIALAETAHGALRVRFLNPRLGDRRARQVGVFTGSLIFLLITWWTMPWINATTTSQCLQIGLLWLMLMLAFDLAFGRLFFRFSWQRLAADFDPRKGGFLGIGMLLLFFAPLLGAKLRGLF